MIFYIPDEIHFILNKLVKNGFKGYVVGGAIRDLVIGLKPRDFDIATNANINDIDKIFDRTIESGKGHDTIGILTECGVVDITRFRGEICGDPLCSLKEDLGMRDFTINALAYDPLTFTLIDPFYSYSNLLSDIVIIRSNDPKLRFEEDPLRVLRLFSIAVRLEEAGKSWEFDKKTFKTVKAFSNKLPSIPFERINKELLKILNSKRSAMFFSLMKEIGILEYIIPEICNNEYFLTNIELLKLLEKERAEIKLAALLYGLDFYSIEKITERLKFSKKTSNRILKLLSNSKRTILITDYGIRKFISSVGKETIKDIIVLKKAISDIRNENLDFKFLEDKIDFFLKNNFPLLIFDLAVSGDDLIKELHIYEGKQIGKILKELVELVLKHPDMNKKSILLKYVKTKLKPGNNPGSKRN